MDAESAIRQLSFAEAQHSSMEAMVAMARHRAELARDAASGDRSEAQVADSFAERARRLHQVDKTA